MKPALKAKICSVRLKTDVMMKLLSGIFPSIILCHIIGLVGKSLLPVNLN